MLALSQCRLNDLEAADIGQEVAYWLVRRLVVHVWVVCALDSREAWVFTVRAVRTVGLAIGVAIGAINGCIFDWRAHCCNWGVGMKKQKVSWGSGGYLKGERRLSSESRIKILFVGYDDERAGPRSACVSPGPFGGPRKCGRRGNGCHLESFLTRAMQASRTSFG